MTQKRRCLLFARLLSVSALCLLSGCIALMIPNTAPPLDLTKNPELARKFKDDVLALVIWGKYKYAYGHGHAIRSYVLVQPRVLDRTELNKLGDHTRSFWQRGLLMWDGHSGTSLKGHVPSGLILISPTGDIEWFQVPFNKFTGSESSWVRQTNIELHPDWRTRTTDVLSCTRLRSAATLCTHRGTLFSGLIEDNSEFKLALSPSDQALIKSFIADAHHESKSRVGD